MYLVSWPKSGGQFYANQGRAARPKQAKKPHYAAFYLLITLRTQAIRWVGTAAVNASLTGTDFEVGVPLPSP